MKILELFSVLCMLISVGGLACLAILLCLKEGIFNESEQALSVTAYQLDKSLRAARPRPYRAVPPLDSYHPRLYARAYRSSNAFAKTGSIAEIQC